MSSKSPGRPRSILSPLVAPLIAVGLVLSSGALPFDPGPLVGTLEQVGRSVFPPPGIQDDGAAGPVGGSDAPVAAPSPTRTSGPTRTPAGSQIESSPMPVPPSLPPGDYLLMPRAELLALPTSGPAWDAIVTVADAPIGRPDLADQDERHGVRGLASALVYARTGSTVYRERAREAVMRAIGTEQLAADNSILALGRQLGSYVLAADLIRLSGPDDERFRAWLSDIRTRELGGHGRWTSLTGTHEDAPNNWGAFAGASRIAASLYLDDGEDVARAAQVLRGFLGDRRAWHAFQPVGDGRDWACQADSYTPVNPACERDGIDLDGAIVRDISRGGSLRWPPGDDGIRYTLESLQGLVLQAELLWRNGYDDPWHWSDDAIRRATRIITESGQSGGDSWNRSSVTLHLPWILNARYGLDLPAEAAGVGRIFGYTDWLYGS
ncbi:MAG: alginate lyase family protein [Chloroflexota bacterium]|nr:alginate lyase family protein [Chloroflexota bacterium]